jgi:DNA recombination protein RmuC
MTVLLVVALFGLAALVAVMLLAVQAMRAEVARLRGQVESNAAPQMAAALQTGLQQLTGEQGKAAAAIQSAAQQVAAVSAAAAQLRTEVAALSADERARGTAAEEAREMLRKLERVIAGSASRGQAGESLLGEVLRALPAPWREYDVRIGNLPVEFAVPLPGGKVLPIDSKWPAADKVEELSRTTDPRGRAALAAQIEREVERKVDEVAKYLDPERTLMIGIAAVPDAVYDLCVRAHATAYARGVMLVGYSMALPYVLSLLALLERFGSRLDTGRTQTALSDLDRSLRELEESLHGPAARGFKMLENALDVQRRTVADCRRALAGANALPAAEPASLTD